MTRSEFFDEAWVAWVEESDGVVSMDLMLTRVGVSGRARLTLPVANVRDALATVVAVLYADEVLLRGAVEVHLGQHPPRADCAPPLLVQSKRDRVAVHAKCATPAKQVSCARRHRR
jgi:hypothetical protein